MLEVLVVDDDAAVRRMVELVLGDEGFVVRTAATAVDAIARLRQSSPALLLVDLGLPELDGFALLRGVRTLRLASTTRVIVISGRDDEASLARAREMGVDDYLVKPINVVDLVALGRVAKAKAS